MRSKTDRRKDRQNEAPLVSDERGGQNAEKRKKSEDAANARGIYVIELYGLNISRILGELGLKYGIFDITAKKGLARFSVRGKHIGDIIALLDGLCYNYKIIKVKGAVPRAYAIAKRAGLIVGIALFVTAAAVYPGFIREVRVEGELTPEIAAVLAEHGVREGAYAPRVDTDAVREGIMALDGIVFASVRRTGTLITVNVQRELEEVPDIGLTSGPITAKKRAVVTRIILAGGTAEVKYGDVVDAGDVLIGDYLLIGEEKVSSPAGGEVYGNVFYETTRCFFDEETVNIPSDSTTYTRIGMFGRVPKLPASPYETYTAETSVSEYGFLLPFRIYRVTYTEMRAVTVRNTRTEEQMKRETYSSIAERLPAGAAVKEISYTVVRKSGATYVTAVVAAEERIS